MPEDLIFDTEFFQEENQDGYEGGQAVFRLHKPVRVQSDRAMREQQRSDTNEITEVFLTLFNHHNGYYGHGFSFTDGIEMIQEGCL